jgi:hypothetical protein
MFIDRSISAPTIVDQAALPRPELFRPPSPLMLEQETPLLL